MREDFLKEAAHATPDPARSLNNLLSFLSGNPSRADELEDNIRPVSMLFSFSQFLANYCVTYPDILFRILKDMDSPRDRDSLFSVLQEKLSAVTERGGSRVFPVLPLDPHMAAVRRFRMDEILRITLRDILGMSDLVDVMLELSCLADVIIGNSLNLLRASLNEVYGLPQNDAFSVVGLGKLGGEELNFSSDVDLMFVYGTEAGETKGVVTNQGISKNRVSNHEYYCKLGESLTRFLSLNTGDGFAYRVDLRLRPEGQRGAIALALRGYETYYESWGRAWERAMLIRARPVAGETGLGNDFMETVRPFVYRKYLDYGSIDEIRQLKTKIDTTFKKGDIKRGYGGIREIEFFAQALQLLYGGREPLLREGSTLRALHRLLQKALIGQADYSVLTGSYHFLRTLEHRLQQVNDIQTHTLPSGEADQEALGGKMGFHDRNAFIAELEKVRTGVRHIYDSLFADKAAPAPSSGTFFDEELSDSEMQEMLSASGVKDPEKAVRNIKAIKDSTLTFQTLRGRRLMSEILPKFVESALNSNEPDAALNHLQSFASLLSLNESYLEMFSGDRGLVDTLTYVFAQSGYLSKMLMARPQYLEMIGWQTTLKKSLSGIVREVLAGVEESGSFSDAIRQARKAEEIRLGLLFLRKIVDATEVSKGLSRTAEGILRVCSGYVGEGFRDMAVVGLGKLGGREITFGSDLDLIFVAGAEVADSNTKAAEKFLRALISYTREGVAYSVDTRLRPEGSKGPLVSPVGSLREYYAGAAAFWEYQALLKARPVAGSAGTGRAFLCMARQVLISQGPKISGSDIRQMRERILKELSKESEGYDIKLGPGGIEDIEFTVQYLQLSQCGSNPAILVQGTRDAIKRLEKYGIIRGSDGRALKEAYLFYRTIESLLRLKGENVLKRQGSILNDLAEFMSFGAADGFAGHLEEKREEIRAIMDRYLG
ncbi:MAG: bifunctional [glutamate--ammonia ligase]-adenylyl-L-tyrosine phosphorylase/[glutamate--ammonia-ligase] adenylyltransferase [Candidatus Sulfobium sp.]|jgi:glutamate-ammonia-ligase adenylyltransferase